MSDRTLPLTATATPKVQQDILKNLDMTEDSTFVQSFNRDNLFYEFKRSKKNNMKAGTPKVIFR